MQGCNMSFPVAYFVRFKGHPCAAVKTGFSKKPILMRMREGEIRYESPIEVFLESERPNKGPEEWDRLARLKCARAIKRTEYCRKKLQGDHMLRGVASVERILKDYQMTRRGKRWKICPITP